MVGCSEHLLEQGWLLRRLLCCKSRTRRAEAEMSFMGSLVRTENVHPLLHSTKPQEGYCGSLFLLLMPI